MKKSKASRKRVLALLASLFLVTILCVPAFADADTGNVVINGNLVFASDMDLSEYFTLNTYVLVDDGYIDVYDGSGLTLGNCNKMIISYYSQNTTYQLVVEASNDARAVAATASNDYAAVYNAVAGRYLVFHDVLVNRSSPIYQMCRNCAALTSTLTYQNADDTSNNIVDVIVGGFNGVLTGFGAGTADFFETIFLNNDGSLTTFALVGLVFLGVGLSVGIARWVIKKVGQ